MSEENKTQAEKIPNFIRKAPELLPVWDWWVKDGRSTLTWLIVLAAGVCAFYGVRNYLETRLAKANQALVNAYSTDDLEAAVSDYGSTKVGPALRLRLAKSYYDSERYQEAFDAYGELVRNAGDCPALADMALVGRAYALEGLAKYPEAAEAFSTFAGDAGKTNSYLILTARMGALRCQALKGDRDGAVKALEALKAAQKGDALAEMRVERMLDAVKRYEPGRAARSLFDAADAAEKALSAEEKQKKGDAAAKAATPAPKAATTPAPKTAPAPKADKK